MRNFSRALCVLVSLSACGMATAGYEDECRTLAEKLAREPGALKVGELDLLKNCLSGLQRGIVLGEAPPPPSPPPAQDCPVVPVPACPVCPAPVVCPKRESSPAPATRERQRETPAEDRRLRPYLPTY